METIPLFPGGYYAEYEGKYCYFKDACRGWINNEKFWWNAEIRHF